MPRQQRTIREPAELTGNGLFSGKQVHVRLLPADPSTGFLFVRTASRTAPSCPPRSRPLAKASAAPR